MKFNVKLNTIVGKHSVQISPEFRMNFGHQEAQILCPEFLWDPADAESVSIK